MKKCKKIQALVLSILLILSVVVVPAAVAETTTVKTTKYISLLDLSTIPTGTTCTSGLPEGITNLGISTFSANTIGHKFTSTQEIVEGESGKKAWKLDVSAATTGSSNYYDIVNKNNSFSIKFDVPAKYLPYIKGICADFDTAVTGNVRFKFGVIDSNSYNKEGYASRFGSKPGNWADGTFTKVTDNATEVSEYKVEKDITSLYRCHQNQIQNGFATTDTALSETWSEEDKETITNIYLCISRNTGTASSGDYVIINDIGITIEGTEDELNSIPDTKTLNLFDLSQNTVGSTSITYPEGMTQTKEYTGALQIAKSANTGKNAIRMDLANTTFTNKDSNGDGVPDNGGRFNEYSYSPVYRINIDVSVWAPYIDTINIQFNKQSSAKVRYNFGVTNGDRYSKIKGKDRNSTLDANGIQNISLKTDELFKCSDYQTGAYGVDNKDYWNNDFDRLFLYISADYGADGYIDIEDISITYTITAKDYEELEFQMARKEALIADFETDLLNNTAATDCDFAVSGEKALKFAGGQFHSFAKVYINNNKNYVNANGLSFWVYNTQDTTMTIFANIVSTANIIQVENADGTVSNKTLYYYKEIKIEPKKWTKIFIDFGNTTKQTAVSSANGRWSLDSKNAAYNYAMTEEEIEGITHLELGSISGSKDDKKTYWFDDIYLEFNSKKEDKEIGITSDNTTFTDGNVTFRDGKAVFAPGADAKKEAVITVPAGTLSGASMIEYHYTTKLADGTTAPKVQLYANGPWSGKTAANNWTPQAWQIKRGNNTTSGQLESNTSGVHLFDFSVTSGNNDAPIHSWYGSNYGKNNYREPKNSKSPSEECLSAITQITFGVQPFGTVGADEYVTLDKIVIKYKNKPFDVTVTETKNGTVELYDSKANEGDIIQFRITPDEGCIVAGMKITDALGNEIALTDKFFDGQNIDGLFAFKMPASSVNIAVGFHSVSGTVSYRGEYNANDGKLIFDIPVLDGKAFNTDANAYQKLNGFGVILVSNDAFEKHGVDVSKLTLEQIEYYKESGHYLGKYVRYITDKEIIKSFDTEFMISYSVTISDICADARRENMSVITFAKFDQGDGNIITNYDIKEGSFDKFVYGYDLVEEFSCENSVDYSQITQSSISNMTADDAALQLETWQGITAEGYDHVNIVINSDECLDIKNVLIEEYLVKLDKVIDNALRAGICVTVSVNGSNETNNALEQLVNRYENLPKSVIVKADVGQIS